MEILEDESELHYKTIRLDHEWVQVLINLRMKYAKSFTGKRHSATAAWNGILHEMQELGAPKCINRLRLKKKWMNLIAKYKQLKCDADSAKQTAWPYFEQIDRAHSKKQILISDNVVDFSVNPTLEDTNKYMEKETFMRTLIDMRYKFRALFTGKKYAAQKGWMTIQNYVPNGDKYTIDQMSKVWHNLVQRYKALSDSESDYSKITWTYFQQLHKIMSEKNNSVDVEFEKSNELSPDNPNLFKDALEEGLDVKIVPLLTDNIVAVKKELMSADCSKSARKVQKRKSITSLYEIFDYLKEQDRKRDEEMKQMFGMIQEILVQVKK